ncbi:MAG: Co2+/Mg2+ efflux protein ApaG [Cryomorphaceae bacterium BACL29 MAG-121220-bin8]|jgi:ApaG protein|nr:MAG: Co2+/Mg2+ efflux protein ApaG [Cryomorphaceae bacterium BACL29 MAG-121220-bin8]|tara:strand:+ start:13570 stop:13956 length:387 start_codon:yes stop_codon:yes gene_type:complete
MVNHVTKGIEISVKNFYDGSCFKNYRLYFSFNYFVKITNQSNNAIQLQSRHWRIFDSLSSNIIIDGQGVIGQKPLIKPGENFKYSSNCLITSPVGAMRGFYNMININTGKKFRAYIPLFKLTAPIALN